MARIEREWNAEQEGQALASELHKVMTISHRQAKGFIDCHCVTVNGEEITKHGQRLKVGDVIKVTFDPEQTYDVMPPAHKLQAGPFETLWEDTHLLFVFKPAGLLTVPTEQAGEPNLAEAITESYRRRGFKRFNLFIVHRLDRFTSGVLVFAKTPEALHGLKKHFELHRLQRIYCAVLVGELPENSGTLAGHLIEHAKSLKMAVAKVRKGPGGGKAMPPGAKEAVTHYRVIERLPGHTVVEVKLETGRRNQIRVQFADRGFPLLGDQVYGVESPLLDRQALHAELLGFKHPVTDEVVTVTAPMPKDMEAALKALRNQARIQRAVSGVKGEQGIFQPTETHDHKLKRVARAQKYDERTDGDARPRRTSGPHAGPKAGPKAGPSDRPSRPSRPRPDGEARPSRPFGANDRPDRLDRPARPRHDEGDERPRRSFGSAERPARPARPRLDGEARPPRPSGPSDRPARPRREEGEARPRSASGPSARPSDRPARPRQDESDERPRRSFGSAERPARPRLNGEARPPRPSGAADRPARPRREEGEARPRSASGPSARPSDRPARPRHDEGDERPRRSFGAAERPTRPRLEGVARPARPRQEGDARPPRDFGPAGRPARPRQDGDARPPRAFGSAERPARPRSEGPSDRPSRKPAPRTGKPKPRKP